MLTQIQANLQCLETLINKEMQIALFKLNKDQLSNNAYYFLKYRDCANKVMWGERYLYAYLDACAWLDSKKMIEIKCQRSR